MKQPVYETSDGRFWLIDETHPQTDDGTVVCRRLQPREPQPDGSWMMTHTAVMSRKDLRQTIFTYEGDR